MFILADDITWVRPNPDRLQIVMAYVDDLFHIK